MLYPKGQEKDFEEYYLRLNLELHRLRKIANQKFL
jgi:hypothetical protein